LEQPDPPWPAWPVAEAGPSSRTTILPDFRRSFIASSIAAFPNFRPIWSFAKTDGAWLADGEAPTGAKNAFTLGRSDHQRQYEPILYGWAEGGGHYWC
jgi:hypothetical protein